MASKTHEQWKRDTEEGAVLRGRLRKLRSRSKMNRPLGSDTTEKQLVNRIAEIDAKYKDTGGDSPSTAKPGTKTTAAKTTPKTTPKADTKTTAAKTNGKAESFNTWFGRKYKELGEGKTADWTDPKTGKKRSILLTHDKSKLAPKGKKKKEKGEGVVPKAVKAVKKAVKPVPDTPATRKIVSKSAVGGGPRQIGAKRGATQRSKMRRNLRDEGARSDAEAKKRAAAAAASEKAAAPKPKTPKTPKTPEPESRHNRRGKSFLRKIVGLNEGGSVSKPGYKKGGKVRGVGAAKRGFGRGKIV